MHLEPHSPYPLKILAHRVSDQLFAGGEIEKVRANNEGIH